MRSVRRDITNSLIHITGDRLAQGGVSAEDALCSIIRDKVIRSSASSGYIRDGHRATCFTEMPLSSLKLFVDGHSGSKRFSYYGIAMARKSGWDGGARPVIYLPKTEAQWIPHGETWRHVTLEHGTIDWTHEREWRCKGDLAMGGFGVYAIVPDQAAEHRVRQKAGASVDWILGFLHLEYIDDIL